ncbi:MAG: hypothetical protein UT24_C0003G0011 [Candidatus Woesebacteria bacterium GW2011_GWB1_39_12]|uniref:Uncharacterized protein n=1 Tax=Candidatus Woesebacteria bacterium GW2011_GWB1_39_12 TaxID=1618574 RepID=A0A0G0MC60_9BACT|nr:MAG: hypothetical protein UT24_C0003G0011 [Candidatus Woesebacteria bacterium GW2011_GWB1_39_12]
MENAEVISSYSRAQAIEDGILVDISNTSEAKEAGFKIPVALTRAVYSTIEEGIGINGQDRKGRLWDICFMATRAFRNFQEDKHLVPFEVLMLDKDTKMQTLKLWLTFNEYEGFTIMYPEDY